MAVLLAPTALTVPAGTTYLPNQSGVALPAGLSTIALSVDHASMPVTNTMSVLYEAQFAGDPAWSTFAGMSFVGGMATNHGVTTGTSSCSMSLDPSRYPTMVRLKIDNGPTPSQVTVSGQAT